MFPKAVIPGLALLLAAGLQPLCAQRYNFQFYGEDEGLQNLAVQEVTQDRQGFIWVATQNGLFRYDGDRFVRFAKTEGLPGLRIESLQETVDGTLWVGTATGVARRKGDRFVKVDSPLVLGATGRQSLAADRDGRLYIATPSGLVVGTASEDRSDFAPVRGSTGPVYSVYVDGSGAVWFGCGQDLCEIRDGMAHKAGIEMGLPADRWDAILGDLDGTLWVRSARNLYVRGHGSRRFTAMPRLPDSTNTFPTLALDPNGRLLVPTNDGLARQSDGGWQMVQSADGLTTNDISSVLQDREGNVWLGLLGSGLARWLGYNEWQSWSDREGLTRDSVWSIARDKSGRLWIGTQFGLNYAQMQGSRLTWKSRPIAGVNMIRSLAAAPDGSLWIGGDPGGLIRLEPESGATQRFLLGANGEDARVRHVAVDHSGGIWVAARRGLFHRAKTSGAFERVSLPGTSPQEGFLAVQEDGFGRIWVCGDLGLAVLDHGTWTRITEHDGLKASLVSQVAVDAEGSAWVGYRDALGITRVHLTGGKMKLEHITVANGLRSDKVVFLGFDPKGWFWVGTDHGVDVLDGRRWRHYGRSDGLIWDDCNSAAFFADHDGSAWIGTSKGLSRFTPKSGPVANVPPPVVFTAVKFGDQRYDPAGKLDVTYALSSLQVRFAALTFAQASNVLFRYRMAGVDPAWLETTQRELNYPQLPPGNYVLEVMARSNQGVWSEQPARLMFAIGTPWWLEWWFRLAAVVGALGMGWRVWMRRTRRLEAERQRLESAVDQRTRELSLEKQRVLEEKARAEQENAVVQRQKQEIERLLLEAQQASKSKSEFLANMSHEIRTPMNGILGMTDMVLASDLSGEQRDYLETARFSAESLLTILNDILDFSKIEAGRMDLNPMEFHLQDCVTQTGKIFQMPITAKGLDFRTDFAEDLPERVVGDPDRLRQILLNLIGNAVKFTERGEITVRVQLEQRDETGWLLLFTVRDTGIGIPRDKQSLIFEAFRQADGSTTRKYGGTGLGLAISARLVELMGGTIQVESEPRQGSVFRFTTRLGLAGARTENPDSLRNLAHVIGMSQDPGMKLQILLAEDNVVNQRVARRLLEKRGHEVTVVGTGHEALEQLERQNFDVILMDVQMPDLDGLETTRIIRQQETGRRTPIVALTAHTMKGDRERCLAAGMDYYVTKPVNAETLIDAVEGVVISVASGQPKV